MTPEAKALSPTPISDLAESLIRDLSPLQRAELAHLIFPLYRDQTEAMREHLRDFRCKEVWLERRVESLESRLKNLETFVRTNDLLRE